MEKSATAPFIMEKVAWPLETIAQALGWTSRGAGGFSRRIGTGMVGSDVQAWLVLAMMMLLFRGCTDRHRIYCHVYSKNNK